VTRGPFFALDGLDGTGKSTQCRLLAKWLRGQGYKVAECADPGGTPIGDELRDLLLGRRHAMTLPCEMLLFMASRAQLTSDVIRPALDSGHAVVADRFLLANVVYQGHAGGLEPDLLWNIGAVATGGLLPNLTLVLDLPLKKAVARRTRPEDRIESRGDEYQKRVREGFLAEARRFPKTIRVIDANQAIEAVHQQIRTEVGHVLAARQGT
jgi:dTMP kinase